MTFTNITGVGFYLQCCHRAVEPGGSFQLPWETARNDRGLRAAMNAGRLAWQEGPDEVKVPGSPKVPDFKAIAKAKADRAAKMAEAEAARIAAKKAADAAGIAANMANMGHFDVPVPVKREVRARQVDTEKPVTKADILVDGAKPVSLEALRRHNKATRQSKDG